MNHRVACFGLDWITASARMSTDCSKPFEMSSLFCQFFFWCSIELVNKLNNIRQRAGEFWMKDCGKVKAFKCQVSSIDFVWNADWCFPCNLNYIELLFEMKMVKKKPLAMNCILKKTDHSDKSETWKWVLIWLNYSLSIRVFVTSNELRFISLFRRWTSSLISSKTKTAHRNAPPAISMKTSF